MTHFGGNALYWPGWGRRWGVSITPPPKPRPFLLSMRRGRGLSLAALDIWSVSARRPPPRQPLLSSAPCVSTFLWTNTALNNSVCSASMCPGAAVQTRLRGRDVWYPNSGLKKKPRRVRGPTDNYVILETLTDYFNIYMYFFNVLYFLVTVVNSNLYLSMLYFYY